jgi:hypothetical protein
VRRKVYVRILPRHVAEIHNVVKQSNTTTATNTTAVQRRWGTTTATNAIAVQRRWGTQVVVDGRLGATATAAFVVRQWSVWIVSRSGTHCAKFGR